MQFQITDDQIQKIVEQQISSHIEDRISDINLSIENRINQEYASQYTIRRDYYSKPEVKREILDRLEKEAKELIFAEFEKIWQDVASKNIKRTVRQFVLKKAEEEVESCKQNLTLCFEDEKQEEIDYLISDACNKVSQN